MRIHIAAATAALLLAGAARAEEKKPAAPPPPAAAAPAPALAAGDVDKALYALGLSLAREVGVFNLSEADLVTVQKGLQDGVRQTPKFPLDEGAGRLVQELAQARFSAAGEALLKRAAAVKGAERSASGLVYQSLKEGTGAQPAATDKVKVHYVGTFAGGKVFDSSVERKQPATFPLNQVIPCWTEGVQKMKVGGKARLVCPPAIAYGAQGRPPQMPPNAVLDFEVELLDIEAPAAPPAPAPAPKN